VTGDSHRPPRSGCAINDAIEVLGDPWSMLVELREKFPGALRATLSNPGAGCQSVKVRARMRAQHSNTDQQMSFRNLWSSSTSSRIDFGS
jgi:hypothetical protein